MRSLTPSISLEVGEREQLNKLDRPLPVSPSPNWKFRRPRQLMRPPRKLKFNRLTKQPPKPQQINQQKNLPSSFLRPTDDSFTRSHPALLRQEMLQIQTALLQLH